MSPSRPRQRRVLGAALAALAPLLLLAPVAAAHAELTTSSPAADSSVPGPLADPIVLTFSEAVADGSKFAVVASDGTTAASGSVDPADATKVTATPATPLAAGTYEVRWTSIADDGHVERGTFRFMVAQALDSDGPTPAPSEGPAASAPPAPTATASADPSPSASPDTSDPTGSAGSVILPIAVALVVIVGLGAYLLRRRGAAGR